MISEYDYKTSSFGRTFDCYDFVDCFNYMGIHDLLKLYKHGFSKVTDHASREIRYGRLSRDQGLALVQKYELKPPKYLDLFQQWLNVKPKALQFLLDQHRNSKFWTPIEPVKWKYNGLSLQQNSNSPPDTPDIFTATHNLKYDSEEKYIVVGKGWP